jgi:hypothetical protein
VRLVPLLAVVLGAGACQRTEQAPSAAADCARVAETLATFEMGPTATPDARAPVVAKHKAACESAHVTTDEAACLGRAKDTWAARACLPRMFPAKPVPTTGQPAGCSTVAERMRAAVMSEVGSNGSAASAQLDKILPVIQASCQQDSWPANVVQCIVDAKVGDMAAFQTCANQLPAEMQQNVTKRLTAALQQEAPSAPAPTPPAK